MFMRGIGIVAIITVFLCLGECTMKSNNTNNTETKDRECGFNRPEERDIKKGRTSA